MVFAIFLAVRKRDRHSGMPWQFRAMSLIAGVAAAQVYIYVCLSPEIKAWHF